jgi:hypothetical protein
MCFAPLAHGENATMSATEHRRGRPVIVVPEAMLEDIVIVPDGDGATPWYVREVAPVDGSLEVRFERVDTLEGAATAHHA